MPNLDAVMKHDKFAVHGYHRFWFPIFHRLTQIPLSKFPAIATIGNDSTFTHEFWRSFQPTWKYFALNSTQPPFQGEGVEFVNLDCVTGDDLDKFVERETPRHQFLFVTDDNTHIPDHQVDAFNKMFPCLASGGVYFIEDIETSYWTRGVIDHVYPVRNGFRNPNSIVERFKNILDVVNDKFLHYTNINTLQRICEAQGFDFEVVKTIRTITFGPNFVSVEKKVPEEDDPFATPYRFANFL